MAQERKGARYRITESGTYNQELDAWRAADEAEARQKAKPRPAPKEPEKKGPYYESNRRNTYGNF